MHYGYFDKGLSRTRRLRIFDIVGTNSVRAYITFERELTANKQGGREEFRKR
jgi:hypothetical protein